MTIGEDTLDATLSFGAWFWLLVPMCSVIVLSIITCFADRRRSADRGWRASCSGSGALRLAGIALIAIWIAQNPESGVLELVSYAWGGFGAAFGPVLILSLFWRRMTRNGALAGMIVGAATVVIWKQLSGGPAGIFDLYEILPGFILDWIAIVLVSRMGSEPGEEVQAEFGKMEEGIR